jgi:TonB-linked SusC/RagA family outer membrane protein
MKRLLLTLLMLIGLGLSTSIAQTLITGRVLDEKGQGLIGATISVKGSPNIGTVTDLDGNFRLSAPANSTLVVQSIGYATQEVPAGAAGVIRMKTAAKELSGAVVTALAIRREKRELGYSATTINADELNAGNNPNALTALQGKTAGVNITSSTGGPGSSTRVVLRGEKSIGGNNNALIVVDGVIIDNSNRLAGRDARYQIDFGNRGNDINPEDIENITVLKGPAAAALYGSLGANGAIMITTKSGRGRVATGKNNVTYQMSYYMSDPLKLPDYQNKYGQGDLDNIPDDRRENFSWGYEFDGKLRPWGQVIDGKQKIKPYSALPNNVRDFFERGQTLENNVSLGGSNEKASYYLSLNALNNRGVVPYNFFNKYSVRLNSTLNVTDKIYASSNINYVNTYSRVEQSGQGDEGVLSNIYQQPRDIPIRELRDLSDPFNAYGTRDTAGVEHYGYYGAYTDNPYFMAANTDNRNRTDRILGNINIGVRPNANWDIFNRIGIDFVNDRVTSKIPKFDLYPYDEFYTSAGGPQRRNNNGGFYQSTSTNLLFNDDVIANYTKQLTADLGFTGLLGANLQFGRRSILAGNIDNQTNGLVIPGFYNLNNAQGPPDITDNYFDTRSVGLYSSMRIDYRRQIFIELTGRNDWTSTLAFGNNSYFYPSANLSWVFTESFRNALENQNILSFGKIRGGYSSVGNGTTAYNNNDPAFIRAVSETGFGSVKFPFNGTPGFTYQNIIGNLALRPERTNSFEAGIELAFFRNRLTFEGTIYNALTIDQIVNVPTPPSTGFTTRVINLGDVRNKGVELAARVTPVQTASGFRWELFGTYTKNKGIVERLPNGVSQVSLGGISGMTATATVGKPYGAFYGTDVLMDSLGRVVVDSATGLPRIGPNTIYKGSYQPRFIASWGTNLRFKGFQLNVLFQTKQGGVFFSRTKDLLDFTGTAAETEDREDHVFPNSVYLNYAGNYVVNTDREFHPYNYYTATTQTAVGRHIIDASYVKLQEVSLSYTMPEKWLKHSFFGSAQVGVFGNNLYIWTAKENKYSDPEMNAGGAGNLQGFDYISRPSLRNYGFNLRVTF